VYDRTIGTAQWVANQRAKRAGQAADALAGFFGREVSPDTLREYAEISRQAESSNELPYRHDEENREADRDADVPRATRLDDLTPTAWKLLQTLRSLGAVTSEKALARAKIAEKAGAGNHDSKHIQEAFALLKRCGLIIARNNVGTWLTAAGVAAANACK
jgi:hypothetical protein